MEAGSEEGDEEVWREVVGLRERTVYEFWVRAATAAGAGPPTRPVTAAPTTHGRYLTHYLSLSSSLHSVSFLIAFKAACKYACSMI